MAVASARGTTALLMRAVMALSQGAVSQAASIEETSASMEEMASMVRRNADHSKEAASLMASVGHGTALFGAKCVAGALGMCLHLREIHSAVAALAGFYVAVAIVPWVTILLM